MAAKADRVTEPTVVRLTTLARSVIEHTAMYDEVLGIAIDLAEVHGAPEEQIRRLQRLRLELRGR